MDYAASILARLPTRKRAIGLDGLVKKIQGYLSAEQVALENAIIRGAVYWEDRVWAADSIDGVVYQSVDDIQGEATTGTTVP